MFPLRFALASCMALIACTRVHAEEPKKPARFLAVTVTTGFRHESISTAEPVLEDLGRSSGFYHIDFLRMPPGRPPQPKAPKRADGTSDDDWKKQEDAFKAEQEAFRKADTVWQAALKEQFARVFSRESLDTFDGVMFVNTTGGLPIPDVTAFLEWIKTGKAFVGMHSATDTLMNSGIYADFIGGRFNGHPWGGGGQHAFVVHESGHRLSAMFPARFRWRDEIYQYSPRFNHENLRVLVSLDMAASTPKEPVQVPVSWVRTYGSGRVFYTNFGHNEATWKEPTFQKHISEGIAWATGRFDADATPNPDVQAAEYVRSVVAAAAAATGKNADDLLAKVDARGARDAAWATGLRPMLLEIRDLAPEARADAYAKVLATIEK